ncbi:hypothetical protein [Sulfurisphaera ohwakuensis]|uniref:Uncharacterized protein n=1 Tax=Sulfurisphaera ohwakuensis TaxID=69656 RepID=A0A650CGD0_SULOH|nr:hypothetical protein [Sulfurisphaera ohwakuensis]MBB5254920.1 hypothetical protein [Sulfurisphaera ohwakuensis]QGR16597.1 hypothetical protein D1869_04850 [Sulfurisphaera ohwakuensis]
MYRVFKNILLNRFYLSRNIRAIAVIALLILLLPTEYILGGLGIGNVIALASSSSTTNLATEPINYTLSLLHVILHFDVSQEYISSYSTNNYSGYVVANANGWIVTNNTNYTFTYFGKTCYNNYTFDTISLVNTTLDGDILVKITYNITLINIPEPNGMDSVAKITRTYMNIKGIEPESIITTTQFYWFNYTKSEIGNNEYNISFNSYVGGIKATGYIVEDPSGNSIMLSSGSVNIIGNGENITAIINDNEITIYSNNSNDPVTINIDPIQPICFYYSWGYVKGILILANVSETTATDIAQTIASLATPIGGAIGGWIGLTIGLYITYNALQYKYLLKTYSEDGIDTIYHLYAASFVKVNILVWSDYIPTESYWETGVYYNGEYYPFMNSIIFAFIRIPNYNFGYFIFEQPHSSIIPPPPYSPPWYSFVVI